jgi:hypothetical protein
MSSSSQNPAITTMNLSGIHGFISIQRFCAVKLYQMARVGHCAPLPHLADTTEAVIPWQRNGSRPLLWNEKGTDCI